MINQKIIFPVFIVVVLLQLFVPAKMIFDQESVWEGGTEFKFKTEPIDPNDLFRGKYVALGFSNTSFNVNKEEDWQDGENVFVEFTIDGEGFAQIASVYKTAPKDSPNYLSTQINYIDYHGKNSSETKRLVLDFPFNRFYMEESKAQEAEDRYRSAMRNNSGDAYALVNIKEGRAVLKNVLLNGVPLKDLVQTKE